MVEKEAISLDSVKSKLRRAIAIQIRGALFMSVSLLIAEILSGSDTIMIDEEHLQLFQNDLRTFKC
jgi:hypothetical protein